MSERIVDLVFAPRGSRWVVRLALALPGAAAILGLIVLLLHQTHPLHEALADAAPRPVEHEIALPPRPPPPPAPAPEPPRTHDRAAATARAAVARQASAPAQAGRILARDSEPNAPVDLGDSFVTGTGAVYAGGRTTSSGTGREAVQTSIAKAPRPSPPRPAAPDRSKAVALEDEDWSCPWPPEADAEEIDERVVVVQVVVRPDGMVESARLVTDPGHGFGPAALSCARRSRFTAALDRDGRPVRAESPPVRVRFTR